MWFWIAGAVVLVAVAALIIVAGALRRDVVELQRVADLAQERVGFAQQRLQPRADRLQQTLASLERHAAGTGQRLAAVPPARTIERDTGATAGSAT